MNSVIDDCKNAEINCICKISEIIASTKDFKDVVCQVLDILPDGFQFPSITCIRIMINGKKFKTSHFKITPWKLSCSCTCSDSEVVYLFDSLLSGRTPGVHMKVPFFQERKLCFLGQQQFEKLV
jgi:hypothetical protein